MSRDIPYMPLYVERFDVDTSHLSFEEDGAYNRLLRLCWRQSGCSLPDDKAWLTRNLRTDAETFERVVEPVISEFFQRRGGRIWQKRQREEFAKAVKLQRDRRAAGIAGAESKRLKSKEKGVSKASAKVQQSTSDPEAYREGKVREEGSGGDAREASSEGWSDPEFEALLVSAGIDPSKDVTGKWHGSTQRWEADRWRRDLGLDFGEADATIRESRNGKVPGSLAYFTPAMQRAAARKSAPKLVPIDNPAIPPPRFDVASALAAEAERLKARQ